MTASAIYLFGALLPTAAFNVPMNNRLDRLDRATPDAAEEWTRWNHVRTVASAAAMICFLIGLLMLGRG